MSPGPGGRGCVAWPGGPQQLLVLQHAVVQPHSVRLHFRHGHKDALGYLSAGPDEAQPRPHPHAYHTHFGSHNTPNLCGWWIPFGVTCGGNLKATYPAINEHRSPKGVECTLPGMQNWSGESEVLIQGKDNGTAEQVKSFDNVEDTSSNWSGSNTGLLQDHDLNWFASVSPWISWTRVISPPAILNALIHGIQERV